MINDLKFKDPSRQSYVAILIIIYKLYKTLVKQLWPFLIIFVVGGNFSKDNKLVMAIAVVGVLSTIYGIIAFFKYYFYIDDDQLIVEKGVIRKSKTSIPMDRIQSVDFEQNLIHRLFNVVKVKIDTAGSAAKELELNALNIEKAESLRTILLSGKKQSASEEGSDFQIHDENAEGAFAQKKKILSINVIELLKVGISANHFKSAWLVVFFLFWIYENLDDAGIDLEPYKDQIPDESIILQSIALTIGLIVFFVVISFLISLVRTVLKYYNLSFFREAGKFKITSGLFNKREVAALDNKVQIVQWSQNLLQKTMDLFELKLSQASSAEAKLKNAIIVPGIQKEQINQVNDYLFENNSNPFSEISKSNKAYFYRNFMYMMLVFIPITGLMIYSQSYKALSLIFIIILYQVVSLYLQSKKYGISYSDNQIKVYGGTFGSSVSLFYIHKIQALKISQNIYQRRNNLADLTLMTAGGKIQIPYLDKSIARKIENYCLMQVETSRRKWM